MSVEDAYQKPLLYNKFLPYGEKLGEEGRQLFEEIKQNLSIAVQKSELWPGALFWTNRLNRYILCVTRCIEYLLTQWYFGSVFYRFMDFSLQRRIISNWSTFCLV